jgi:proline iminopeptidase
MHGEMCGNADGVPLVFVHGGPGGGSLPHHRRFYDPSFWRIVLYDQRGAGRSTPVADIVDNTTAHLVNDLDRLRAHLGVERWVLFGGSWGSTLALAYAETYPQRVLGLVLRGIFLATPNEIEWFLYGMRYVFPEAWRAFTDFLPEDEREDLLAAYYKRLVDPDPAVHLPAARAWDRYEAACSTLLPKPEMPIRMDDDAAALAIARIEAHYFVNNAFLAEDELIGNLHRIRHLPCTIVQGRYDVVCPARSAWALKKAWPEVDLRMVPDAGHSAFEPGNARELVMATDRFAKPR